VSGPFLWLLRDAAVSQPHYSVADLAKLDNRLVAHLDGLRIAGEAGWSLVQESLSFSESGELFVAAELAFELGAQKRIDAVSTAANNPEAPRGIVLALGWLPYERAHPHIQDFLASSSPRLRHIGIAASAIHRHYPGTFLPDAMSDNDPLLRARAFRAAGELARKELLPKLQSGFADPDQNVRFAAAWSDTLLSVNLDSLTVLRAIAESPDPNSAEALQLTVRRMDLAAAKAWQASLSKQKASLRLAIIAAGAIGDPDRVPWLIEQMNLPALARVAGEAFTMITGIDLAYNDLEKHAPEGFEAGPTENPEDENVEMDPDENLPWPDPALIQKWWNNNQSQFQKSTHYLLGKPMTIEWLQQVLRIGRQRQRAAAALELAIRQPGQPLFEVRAPGFRQQAILGLSSR
jgi:uncharacterized protein (TIGR02270 family)